MLRVSKAEGQLHNANILIRCSIFEGENQTGSRTMAGDSFFQFCGGSSVFVSFLFCCFSTRVGILCVSMCVCVCVRERESVCVCVCEATDQTGIKYSRAYRGRNQCMAKRLVSGSCVHWH